MREMDWLYFMAQQRGWDDLANAISDEAQASQQRLFDIEERLRDASADVRNMERQKRANTAEELEPERNVLGMPPFGDTSRPWQFTLYVAGRGNHAFANLKEVLADRSADEYSLRVVNVDRNPGVAEREGIVFTPTVIASYMGSKIEFVGDISRIAEVRRQLALHEEIFRKAD